MNNEKQSTVKKSIRIPKRVAEEIEKEAAKKNQSFSDTVNYRLQHFQSPLTPTIWERYRILQIRQQRL